MVDERREFIEGFMVAARIYWEGGAGENASNTAGAFEPLSGMSIDEWEKIVRGTSLSMDNYLAIPTYIRQGKHIRS